MTLFDTEKERLRLTHRPIRLFEAFSGIGCQAMALKRLGVEIEHVGISEIDKYALQSYAAIHGDVKNYGDIMKVNGADLGEIDIFTWSFPCTDLSKAGKQKGLHGGTRSGLGYQVVRIISEMKVKPKVLLMENVPDLLGEKFKEGWREIYHEIEKLGYSNYVETLNAKNDGVAQNRDRVFMVSILGDYSYTFPRWVKLEKRLKDYLEENVDEKYYLSEKQINQINNWKSFQNPFDIILDDNSISPTITTRVAPTRSGGINASMIVYEDEKGRRMLTERETWRLMGVDDYYFNKAFSVSNGMDLYQQAGNGICVPVLEAIFKEML
jgi:DNA (cytosine-5)-methyltransferase 1